ncbi:MAG: fused MFS/spermidine synthase [Gemmatimonadales bacterium]
MLAIVYILFILSGAAGLIYETLWSRYLSLFVGHSAYAQIIVLAMFLGGMALGSLAAGKRSSRFRDPLLWYAGVEAVVGILGLGFHDLYLLVTNYAYDTVFPVLHDGFILDLAKWLIAGSLLLPQSILMGTTFPLIAAGVLRRVAVMPGRTISILYFANSIGAAIGVLVTGFYLIALAGLPGTLVAASITNLSVALVAWGVVKRYPCRSPAEAWEVAPEARTQGPFKESPLRRAQLWRMLLAVSFGTALASFFYEIGWIRMLALVIGSATHSFELMLSAFILGLALGSWWVRKRADRWAHPLRNLGMVQWIMGAAALATLPLYHASFEWTAGLIHTFTKTSGGYAGFTVARYVLCLAIMLPATFCAGITLPLITRTLVVGGVGEKAIGSVYGVNTLGSIVGTALAGLLLMPLIGLRMLLLTGATIDMLIGVAILFTAARYNPKARRLAYGSALATMLAAGAVLQTGGVDQRVLSSGVFRLGSLAGTNQVEILYYKDGRTATVSAFRTNPTGNVTIATNGKPDGSLPPDWFLSCSDSARRPPLASDAATQALAPLIALAHSRGAKHAAVIGQGTGMSSHLLLSDPELEDVTTVEIESRMLEGSRVFYPINRRTFDDPRSRFVIEDAKTYFAAAGRKYDIIFSEPSNPWVSGVSSLFTTEFYGHVTRYLTDDGIFGQWIHLYEIDDALILSVLAAMNQHFGTFELFMTAGSDMLIVASKNQQLPEPDWSIFSQPSLTHELCLSVPLTPQALEAARVAGRAAFAPLLDKWTHPNSDFYPLLDLSAERARFLRHSAVGFRELTSKRFDIVAPLFGHRIPPSSRPIAPVSGTPRLTALARGALVRNRVELAIMDSALSPREREAVYMNDRWIDEMQIGTAPSDWRIWLDNFKRIERIRSGGTAGFIEEKFYEQVNEFLARHRAPPQARTVVSYYRSLAAWDFAAASLAADSLLVDVEKDENWITPEDLLEGGVVAKLRIGDTAGAKILLEKLRPRYQSGAAGLRLQLLDSYIRATSHADG